MTKKVTSKITQRSRTHASSPTEKLDVFLRKSGIFSADAHGTVTTTQGQLFHIWLEGKAVAIVSLVQNEDGTHQTRIDLSKWVKKGIESAGFPLAPRKRVSMKDLTEQQTTQGETH